MQFEVGDKVRLRTGESIQRVTHVDHNRELMSTAYLSGSYFNYDRPMHHFELVEAQKHQKPSKPKKETKPMTKLFETKAEPKRYGSFLANDSQGKFVLEMKGNPPSVEAFAEDELKEVIPYTVEIEGTPYVSVEGQFKVGDLLTTGNKIVMVNRLDTAAHNAKKLPANLRRVLTEDVK